MIDHIGKNRTAQRKVREDFNKDLTYVVAVLGYSEDVKKEVQQAFFDIGYKWWDLGESYQYFNVLYYSNSNIEGKLHLLGWNKKPMENSISPKEFIRCVYEPEQQGHVHAESMALYAEDAKTHAEPWKLWQLEGDDGVWRDCLANPSWANATEYRRKPKTRIVHGVEITDLRIKSYNDDALYGDFIGYCADPLDKEFRTEHYLTNPEITKRLIKFGILYEPCDEGEQAAIMHTKALLGVGNGSVKT